MCLLVTNAKENIQSNKNEQKSSLKKVRNAKEWIVKETQPNKSSDSSCMIDIKQPLKI